MTVLEYSKPRSPFRLVMRAFIIAGTFYGLYLTSLYNFRLFHTLAELFAILIAMGAWVIVWNVRYFLDNKSILFLGIGFLFVGSIDLAHTLTYPGINVFPGSGANLSNQLWLAARYMQAGSLLVAPLISGVRIHHRWMVLFYTGLTISLLASILYFDIFPDAFIEGVGLTTFKIASEYIIAVVLSLALIIMLRSGDVFDRRVRTYLSASIGVMILSELAFTQYTSAVNTFNIAGHMLKIVAFYLVYKAMIETGLTRPYELLFRNLQKSRDELQKERDFFSVVLNTTNALVVVLEPNGRIVRVNRACEQITGYRAGEMESRYVWETGLIAESPMTIMGIFANQISEGHPVNHESNLISRDNQEHKIAWTSTSFINQNEVVEYIISAGIDITERKHAEEELRYLSTHDILTGLYNRTHFESEMVQLAGTDNFPASIVVVDVDGLKEINDNYGHTMGDKLLQRTAGILKSAFRSGDIIARVGGDEFAILLPEADEIVAEHARKRVKSILRAHNRKHPELPISLSSGSATAEAGYMLMETLKYADQKMYREKSSHKVHPVET
jgi:diguanylate cyclase (GGDEF)-like protein/PAS domain S-box-containing protein